MSLAGLLTILDDDPQLHEVVSRAGSDTTSRVMRSAATLAGEDLIAPPTLRPVLAAALTGAQGARLVSCSRSPLRPGRRTT